MPNDLPIGFKIFFGTISTLLGGLLLFMLFVLGSVIHHAYMDATHVCLASYSGIDSKSHAPYTYCTKFGPRKH